MSIISVFSYTYSISYQIIYLYHILSCAIVSTNSNKSYPFYVYTMCYDLCNLYEVKKKKKKQNLFKEEKSCFFVGCTQ